MTRITRAGRIGDIHAANKHVILFLAADPNATDRLALDREARAIHHELKRSGCRDRFDFQTRWAVEPMDVLREVRELNPTVVHFSGHGCMGSTAIGEATRERDLAVEPTSSEGAPSGLVLHRPVAGACVVSPEAVAQTLSTAGTSVRLVVLNACFTESVADVLLAHVDCVVGVRGSIHDDAARIFATGFYGALGEQESIAMAYEQGKAAMNLEGLRDADRPQLKVRGGFDSSQLILAAVEPSLRRDVRCPYPGMRPYAADHGAGFRGRDAEITDILSRLRAGERELYVIGPSGSGKSSLVAAGLLPRLGRGVAGLGPFAVREFRPGEAPSMRLREALEVPPGQPLVISECVAAALKHRANGYSLLIVVDQLEELFTLASAEQRDLFLATIRQLRAESRCVLVFTLRADFFGELMESSLWETQGQLSRIEVSPLRGEALREAITAPARDVGVVVEPALSERLLADAASEPGILPLLQEALVQLWEARVDQTLTLADYHKLGDGERSGLAVALARRADATLRRFTTAQTAIARRIFLRLVSFGEGRSDTRRQQPRLQLRAAGDDEADFAHVLQVLIEDRLLTIDEDDEGAEPRVDLAHEIMIPAWPTLNAWIRSHRADEQRRRQLETAADRWLQHGRGTRGLLDLIELAEAEAWQRSESAVQLGRDSNVTALIAASRAANAARRRRRRGLLTGAFVTLGAFIAVVTGLALSAERHANAAQRSLASVLTERGRAELEAAHPRRAAPYLAEAYQLAPDEPGLRMLLGRVTSVLDARRWRWTAPPGDGIAKARFAGKSRIAAVVAGELRRWRIDGTELPIVRAPDDAVVSWAVSPDETRIATGGAHGSIDVWDMETGARIAALQGPRHDDRSALVTELEFTERGDGLLFPVYTTIDGKPVAWAFLQSLTTPEEVRAVVPWATVAPIAAPMFEGAPLPLRFGSLRVFDDLASGIQDITTGEDVARMYGHLPRWTTDGRYVLTIGGDDTGFVYERTGKLLAAIPKAGHAFTSFTIDRIIQSDDGKVTMALARGRQGAGILDLNTGKIARYLRGIVDASRTGRHVVLKTDSRTDPSVDIVEVVDIDSDQRFIVDGVPDALSSANLSDDGSLLVTWGDRELSLWQIPPLTRAQVALGDIRRSALSRDKRVFAVAEPPSSSRSSAVRIFDLPALAARPLISIEGTVTALELSTTGAVLGVGASNGNVTVWKTDTGKLQFSVQARSSIRGLELSPDGTFWLSTSRDGTITLWDASGRKHAAWGGFAQDMTTAHLTRDSSAILVTTGAGPAQLRSLASGELIREFAPSAVGAPTAAALCPDGHLAVLLSNDAAFVVDLQTAARIASLPSQGDAIHRVECEHARALTYGTKATQLWDARTGRLLQQLPGGVYSFSSDDRLAAADGAVFDTVTGSQLLPIGGTFIAGDRLLRLASNSCTVIDLPFERRSSFEISGVVARTSPWHLERGRLLTAVPLVAPAPTTPTNFATSLIITEDMFDDDEGSSDSDEHNPVSPARESPSP
jgi:WD40 repeat protein